MQTARRIVKEVVTWPPVNHPLTTAVRAVVPLAARQHSLLARYLPRSGLVKATLPDGKVCRMWSRGDDDIATTLFWRGWWGHEPETSGLFYARAASARTTLDIGAHVGYFSVLAALANPHGQVYAFEPLARVLDRMKRNVALNGLANVSCLSLALGRSPGVAPFFHPADGIPSSSSLSVDFMRTVVEPQRLVSSEVEVTTVDDFVAQTELSGTVDLVKIDTEDTEDQVLEGMTTVLGKDRPEIFCEVLKETTAQRIESILGAFDYEFFLLTPEGPRRSEHIVPHPRLRNFLLAPAGR